MKQQIRCPIPLLALAMMMISACSKDSGGRAESSSSPTTTSKPTTQDCLNLQDDSLFSEETSLEESATATEMPIPDDSAADTAEMGTDDCTDSSPTESPATTEPTTEPTNTETPTTTPSDYAACVAEGKAWIPVGDSGAYCGDALVSWCCQEDIILDKFAAHSDLSTKFDTVKGSGLTLYQCSQSSDGKVMFHFAQKVDSKINYKYLWVKGGETSVAEPDECPAVTPESMGFSAE